MRLTFQETNVLEIFFVRIMKKSGNETSENFKTIE